MTIPGHDDWPPLSEEDLRGIARIRSQLDQEFGVMPEPPRRRDRWRRPLVITLLAVAVSCAGGLVGLQLLTSRTAEPPRPAAIAVSTPPTAERWDPPAAPRLEPPTASRPEAPALAVGSALDAWIDATRRGDIATQMKFYPAVVPVFYTWRSAPREAVLAEKQKVLGAARVLDIRTGAPTIAVADDGDIAITRFRKDYVIEGPHVRRRGAVIQELLWMRTPAGWKITSERDVSVLTPGSHRGASADDQRTTGRRARPAADTAAAETSAAASKVGGIQAP